MTEAVLRLGYTSVYKVVTKSPKQNRHEMHTVMINLSSGVRMVMNDKRDLDVTCQM